MGWVRIADDRNGHSACQPFSSVFSRTSPTHSVQADGKLDSKWQDMGESLAIFIFDLYQGLILVEVRCSIFKHDMTGM
jgi:hypothetical protein